MGKPQRSVLGAVTIKATPRWSWWYKTAHRSVLGEAHYCAVGVVDEAVCTDVVGFGV